MARNWFSNVAERQSFFHSRPDAVSYTHLDVYKRQAQYLHSDSGIIGVTAVSYTHLDVYKRQAQYLHSDSGIIGVTAVSYTHLDVYKRQAQYLHSDSGIIGVTAVSYTHLDVYKRQRNWFSNVAERQSFFPSRPDAQHRHLHGILGDEKTT
ncbi:hypothetical protein [Erwinia amylovora]